jgi:ABC-2 type transport system permease protein/lipopolysaccharide transport system permease protein
MTTIDTTRPIPVRKPWLVSAAVADLVDGLERWELWSTLGWHDIRQRYRRSMVGPFWLTLSMGMMIGGLAYLYGGVFGQDVSTYFPYLALGMIIFTFISSLITEGSSTFIWAGPAIVKMKAPLSIYIYQMICRNIIILAHNALIFVVILPFVKVDLGWNSFLSVLGLLLVVGVGVWVGLILAALSARFRDVQPIISSVMQIAFFMTPIFWTPSSLPNRQAFVYFNPFYYLVEVVRAPLLGQTPPLSVWLTVIAFNCLGASVAIIFFARCRARIPFWV